MLFSMNILFDILFGGHEIYALKTENGEQSECHCFFTKKVIQPVSLTSYTTLIQNQLDVKIRMSLKDQLVLKQTLQPTPFPDQVWEIKLQRIRTVTSKNGFFWDTENK